MKAFSIEVRMSGETAQVGISGFLDERAKLIGCDLQNAKTVVVDLKSFEAMSSKGILEWVRWVRTQCEPPFSRAFAFQNCPKPFIDQVNSVAGLVPKGSVQSFYIPYICERCDLQADRLCETPEWARAGSPSGQSSAWRTPTMTCPSCNEAMEADVLESRYFKFFKQDHE